MTENEQTLWRDLAEAVQARAGDSDSLQLPEWNLSNWQDLLANAETIALRDGEVLLRRGEESQDLYFLAEGRLGVSVPQESSISISPVITIGPGSVVGELAFLDSRGRSASVWSRGTSRLLRLRRENFEGFKQMHPLLACDLLMAIGRIVAERLRRRMGAIGRNF